MRAFLGLVLFLSSLFSESFITDVEYGKMLYQNPRGIGCDKCHGKKGEGSVIATYKELNKTSGEKYELSLNAPPINELSLQELADGIIYNKGVMPSYFLTQDEIIAIYKYLKEKK